MNLQSYRRWHGIKEMVKLLIDTIALIVVLCQGSPRREGQDDDGAVVLENSVQNTTTSEMRNVNPFMAFQVTNAPLISASNPTKCYIFLFDP